MVSYKQPVREVGNCKIYEDGMIDMTVENIKMYSKFCSGKTVNSLTMFTTGGYGTIFNLNLDGNDFILKQQSVTLDNSLIDMEKEVSIPELLKDDKAFSKLALNNQ